LVKKNQRRFTLMDDKILFLYVQGQTTREIVDTFQELYGADISAGLASKVTNAVIEQVVEWQSRPLDAVYPIVYLDCGRKGARIQQSAVATAGSIPVSASV
jgi:putative transposase